jgi:hypothetical protein
MRLPYQPGSYSHTQELRGLYSYTTMVRFAYVEYSFEPNTDFISTTSVMMLAFTFTAVNPVFLYTPIQLGGLGFTPEFIAAFTALAGAAQAAWLLLVFPRLHKRICTGGVLFYCACAWPVFFASSVVFNTMLRHDLKAAFWATAPLTLVLGSGVAMAFSAFFLKSFT